MKHLYAPSMGVALLHARNNVSLKAMATRNIVGPRVREARRARKPSLTQAELAARLQLAGLNVDRATVAKIECRYRKVDDRELLALANVLGVSATWLLGQDEDAP